MSYQVVYSPRAADDLPNIFDWISTAASDSIALGFVERIETYCRGFGDFPHRGTKRDDLRPGLRLIGFERRATILFDVTDTRVTILRVLYGGREVGL